MSARWEYIVAEYETTIWGADLDEQGRDGWELVCMYPHPHSPNTMRAVFKRPLFGKTEDA